MIHKNYRKLSNLLVDVEEWGQVVIINMLTRYIRTQFVNPNEEEVCKHDINYFIENVGVSLKTGSTLLSLQQQLMETLLEISSIAFIHFYLQETIDENSEKAFYGSDDSEKEEDKEGQPKDKPKAKKPYVMDSDHRLMLRTTKPLLNSRNASVSVSQLYSKTSRCTFGTFGLSTKEPNANTLGPSCVIVIISVQSVFEISFETNQSE